MELLGELRQAIAKGSLQDYAQGFRQGQTLSC
jgi:hypothetical protein